MRFLLYRKGRFKMLDNYILYMHRNKINQKVYIGITTLRVEERWKNGKRV